jgi:hypothetical protein
MVGFSIEKLFAQKPGIWISGKPYENFRIENILLQLQAEDCFAFICTKANCQFFFTDTSDFQDRIRRPLQGLPIRSYWLKISDKKKREPIHAE